MHIGFVLTSFPELSHTFILNQITGLMDRGHNVEIYALRRGNTEVMHPAVQDYGLFERTHFAHPVPRNWLARAVQALVLLAAHGAKCPRACLRALNSPIHGLQAASLELLFYAIRCLPYRAYDVIHCHFGPAGRVAALLRAIGVLRGRLLTSFHGFDVAAYPREKGPDVYRRLFEHGDLFTVNTAHTMERLITLGCPAELIVQLPVGVDLARFTFRERRLAPDGEIRVLTVARLVKVKGIEYGMRAVGRLAATYPNLRYQIVGAGPLRAKLESLARDLKLAERVQFLGGLAHPDVQRLHADAHVLMAPGIVAPDGAQEAQGLAIIEAQATGLPVLATRVGGVPDSLRDGETGFLVPERDVAALAEKLDHLIKREDAWPAMGRAGRRFVEENFDLEQLNDRLVDIYRGLMEHRRS